MKQMKKIIFPKRALQVKLNSQEIRLLNFLTNTKVNFNNMSAGNKKTIITNTSCKNLKKEFEHLVKESLVNEDGSGLQINKNKIPYIMIPQHRLKAIKNNKQLFIISLDCRHKNNSIVFISFEEIVSVLGYEKIRDIKKNLTQLKRNLNVSFEYEIDESNNKFTFYNIDVDINSEEKVDVEMTKKNTSLTNEQEEIVKMTRKRESQSLTYEQKLLEESKNIKNDVQSKAQAFKKEYDTKMKTKDFIKKLSQEKDKNDNDDFLL